MRKPPSGWPGKSDLHEIEIYDFYLDEGITGTIAIEQRPEGARLLKDAKAGKFVMVLVYRIDRLARNTMHFLNVFDKLDKLGITLRSMTEPFDTSMPAGRFTMTMFASIATLERDTILERTSLGKVPRITITYCFGNPDSSEQSSRSILPGPLHPPSLQQKHQAI